MSPRHSPSVVRFLVFALGLLLAACGGGGSGGGSEGEGYSPPPPGGSPAPILASTYVRSFGSRQNDEGFTLAPLSDGGLAISGSMGENNWVGLLDATGFPVSELSIGTRTEIEGFDFETSRVVEGHGAVFVGTVVREQTGRDVVARFRRADGTPGWEQVLDAGRWSGAVTLEDARIADENPQVHPVFDSAGVWQGVWIVARSEANVVGANSAGARVVVPRISATLWFVGPDGAVVSRTRLVYVPAPAQGNVYLDSAAVLDTGSLAVMLREIGGDSQPAQRVVRRIGRDGTIGGPFIEIASGLGSQLRTAGSTLLLVGTANVARLDISAQRIDWTATLSGFNNNQLPDVQTTRVVRGSTAELVLGVAADVSTMARFNLFTGAALGVCQLPVGLKLLSLRGRDSGNLRALLANQAGSLRTVNLDDDCAPIGASEVNLGAALAGIGNFTGNKQGAELSLAGDFVHEFTAYRARRRMSAEGAAFDLLREDHLELTSLVTVVADANGQMGIVGREGVQKRNNAGVLQRTDIMRGIAHAASDDTGRLWATGGRDIADTNYCAGLKVLATDGRAECRAVTGYELSEWSLSKGPGNGVWAWDQSGAENLHFGNDGSVVAYPTACAYDQMDVGPDGTRVGVQEARGVSVCLQGTDGRGWRVELNELALTDNLEIDDLGYISAVAATDGGAAVLMTVRQHGQITGLRSAANITGDADLALLKLDAAGSPQWLRVYGAARDEYGYDLARMPDGGYALLGESNSLDALTPGSVDIMVVRTGPDGHVGRTADGGDSCQACLGSITGPDLREVVARATSFTNAASIPQVVTTSALVSARGEGTTTTARGETNARQCSGNVTNVQEGAVTEPSPGTGTGEGPTAHFVTRALYGGATANPIVNRDPAQFNAVTSTPVGGITRFQWDFEDDSVFDAEGYLQQYNYLTRGPKTVRLRVTDGSGRTHETTQTITVDPAPGYYIRVQPVHADNLPNNTIEGADGSINCRNGANGAVVGACFATRNNSVETTLRAVPATGSAFSQWVGCDSTRAQTEGPPLCVLTGDLDGRERLIEAHFVATARASVTVVMTGASAAQGRVFSQDNALNCPGQCTADFAIGSVVQLQASSGVDGDFVRFESCDAIVDGNCLINIDSNGRSILAVYR